MRTAATPRLRTTLTTRAASAGAFWFAALLASLAASNSAAAQTIDLGAQGNCSLDGQQAVTLALPTGIYTMQPVHGLYDAWFRWPGGPVGCDGSGGNCDNGWTAYWDVRRADGTIEHYPNASVPNSDRWATPALALEHSSPAFITTTEYELLNFFIYDAPCSDNAGGVSLNISPCLAIDIQPSDEAACGTYGVYFGTHAIGVEPISYAWQIQTAPNQWVDLHDGVNIGANAAAFEATNPTDRYFLFRSLSGQDALLRCVISNTCGSIVTNAAPFHNFDPHDPVCPSCDPDTNQDGVADQGDVDYLINVVAGGSNPSGIDPDFNQDGVADQGDIDALINVIAGGQCP